MSLILTPEEIIKITAGWLAKVLERNSTYNETLNVTIAKAQAQHMGREILAHLAEQRENYIDIANLAKWLKAEGVEL